MDLSPYGDWATTAPSSDDGGARPSLRTDGLLFRSGGGGAPVADDGPAACPSCADPDANWTGSRNASASAHFFDVYYSSPRFAVETTIACLSIVANGLGALLLLYGGGCRQKGTAYRLLFYNLSAANALCCLLSWIANNALLLFERHLADAVRRQPDALCRLSVGLMAAMLATVALGAESCVTMLGFAAVQYRSVSRPLVHWALSRRRMAALFLISSWLLTLAVGGLPFGVLVAMATADRCTPEVRARAIRLVVAGATAAVAVEGATYIVIITLGSLVYVKLRRYSRGFWNVRFDGQIRSQKRLFGTTLMLSVTLVLFSTPYMVLYVITLNAVDMTGAGHSALIHYMNLLPYLKFLADPIIYGMRMREVKDGCFRLLVRCGFERNACARHDCATPRSPPPYLMHHVTFV